MKEKINNLELSSTLFLLMFSCTLGIAPYITINLASIDAYFGVIFGFFIGLIPLFIFIYIFNYEIDKPLHIKTKIIFGNLLGTIINIIIILIYFILAITTLFNISNFIISQYLTDTPIILVAAIFSLTVYHAINKGIIPICKTSLIYVIIILVLFILGIIGLVPEIKLENLKPLLTEGIKNPLISGIVYSLILTTPINSILLIPKNNIENNKKTTKYIIITYLIVAIMIILISIITSSCLGRYLLKTYQYPVYITLKKISIFGFIDRIENFLSIQWILSSFILLSLTSYYIKSNINKTNNKLINLFITTIITITPIKIFKNNTTFNNYLNNIYPYILIINIILFIIIFIFLCIKKKKQHKIIIQ